MFIEVTQIHDEKGSEVKRLINIFSIVDICPIVNTEVNNGRDIYGNNTEIEVPNGRFVHCKETYEEIRKMVKKETKKAKDKINRFELMMLEE